MAAVVAADCRCYPVLFIGNGMNSVLRPVPYVRGQAKRHFERVGAVVVVADGELAELVDQQPRGGRVALEPESSSAKYGPSRRMRTCLFTVLVMVAGRMSKRPWRRNSASNSPAKSSWNWFASTPNTSGGTAGRSPRRRRRSAAWAGGPGRPRRRASPRRSTPASRTPSSRPAGRRCPCSGRAPGCGA